MNESLQKWIEKNLLKCIVDEPFVYIEGAGMFLIIKDKWVEFLNDGLFHIVDASRAGQPMVQNLLFDQSFTLIMDDEEMEYASSGDIEFFLFEFGDGWFYFPIDAKPELIPFKYLGKANIDEQVNYPFLGLHGKYEICNGSRDYKDWVKKAKFLGINTLGIVEQQTLAGTYNFQLACKEYGIKPIHGQTAKVKSKYDTYYWIKLYVQNDEGWNNLLHINKTQIVDRFNDNTYITEVELFKLSNGLFIVFCSDTDLDKVSLETYPRKGVFFQIDPVEWKYDSRERDYLLNQKKYLDKYYLDVLPVFINDAFYLDQEDNIIKPILNRILNNANSYRSEDQYFKSSEVVVNQWVSLFNNDDQRAWDTLNLGIDCAELIANECSFAIRRTDMHLPKYEMNKDEAEKFPTNLDLFYHLVEQGFSERISGRVDNEDIYYERIETEIAVLEEGKVIDYFLILADIGKWCRDRDILPGLGRGSSAGSLVSYLLGIVEIDPLKYDLLFERFLNKARLLGGSLPDIDFDCPSDSRQEIIQYIINKYGRDHVAFVGTAQNFKLKSSLKDLARFKGIDASQANFLTSLIGKEYDFAKTTGLFEIAAHEPKLKELIQKHPDMMQIIELMIFQPRSFGIHAAAIIISPKIDKDGIKRTIFDYLPIRIAEGQLITEWEKEAVEAVGMLKEDMLGLTQLDKIIRIRQLIKESGIQPPDFRDIPLDDHKVYELFQQGITEDIFQFNTKLQKDYILKLKPTKIEDLIMANALVRPGAMESNAHIKFIKLKNKEIEPLIPTYLEDILTERYGLFCLSGESNITTNKGYVKLKDIQVGDKVLTENGTFQTVLNKFDNGIKKTIKIRTNFGEELICTPNHKILTQNGWKEAQFLNKKDIIKCYWINEEKKEKGNEKDWLLGHWLGDGCNNAYSTCNEDFAIKLIEILKRNFPNIDNIHFKKYKSNCHYVNVTNKIGGWNTKNDFREFIRSYDLWDKKSFTKYLPNNSTLMTLIGFIEADGNIKNQTIRIKNELMAQQLFELFQSYRIRSYRRKDNDNVDLVGFYDFENKLNYKIKHQCIKSKKIGISCKIPFNDLLEKEKIISYGTCIKRSKNHIKKSKKENTISKYILDEVGIKYEHALWSNVLLIKEGKDENVYDLSVENNHSYVAGGLVVHNCFQEDTMRAFQKITQSDLNEADGFRKVISKLKPGKINPDIEKYEKIFKDAYIKYTNKEEVDRVWNEIIAFCLYSFNRSHAAAYAITGYWACWYKCHYPVEFYATALERTEKEDTLKTIIAEINERKLVNLRSPDINKSFTKYSIDRKTNSIYWSISSIKYVGDVAVEGIIKERTENGLFFSFEEFLSRIEGKKVNVRVISNLIICGAFDEIENLTDAVQRKTLLKKFLGKNFPEELDIRQSEQEHFWILKQKELCGLGDIDFKNVYRKNNAGFSISKYASYEDLQDDSTIDKKVTLVGILMNVIERNTRRGKMGQLELDQNGEKLFVTAWNDIWENACEEFKISKNKIVMISGIAKHDSYKKTNVINTCDTTKFLII